MKTKTMLLHCSLTLLLIGGCGETVPAPSSVETLEPIAAADSISAPAEDSVTEPESSAERPKVITAAPKATAPPRSYSDEAFRMAAHDGNIDIVRSAIKSGTKVNAKEPGKEYTALLMAAYNGHTHIVKVLLGEGATVDSRDHEGKTPLFHACSGPFTETVQELIKAKANVNATELTEGFTPLMMAAALGEKEVVEVLLENGADRTIRDTDGDTAQSHAANAGHDEIAKLLE